MVISYFGNSVAVEAPDGQVFQCHLRRNQELPLVGDKVIWEMSNNESGIITRIAPRTSVLARGDSNGNMRSLAANVDKLLIVMAPAPLFSEHLVDRYLIAAEILKIEPLIVLNKEDLLTMEAREQALSQLTSYQNIPYATLFSSIYRKEGLQYLADLLKGHTAVLVGPSGVGKSSIIAALANMDSIRVGEVSKKGVGKHTTTATRLYHLPQGGSLIDSPGLEILISGR